MNLIGKTHMYSELESISLCVDDIIKTGGRGDKNQIGFNYRP
jgi:hypothetical protein